MTCLLPTPSPLGDDLVFIQDGNLHFQGLYGRGMPASVPMGPRLEAKALKWSSDGSQLLLTTSTYIEVRYVPSLEQRVLLELGSDGYGKIVSANFVGHDWLLTTWEFGRTKLWDLTTGKACDLPDLKTTGQGESWQRRPHSADGSPQWMALLCRSGGDDCLCLHCPGSDQVVWSLRIPTVDAQSLSWSPDGRWLAVLDVPTASPGLYLVTPDGHLFRSYSSVDGTEAGLGTKAVSWSADGHILALARFDGKVELLNTRTFTPLAVVDHSSTIDQRSTPQDDRAPVWQENISASNEHSYIRASQPASPPVTRTKPTSEPDELGVAEMSFGCDGRYLATRDSRMLTTVWVWDMETLTAHAVVIQHDIVRRLLWHPTQPDLLMIDCAKGIAYMYYVTSSGPPTAIHTNQRPRANISWLYTAADAKPVIYVNEKASYAWLYPEGQDPSHEQPRLASTAVAAPFEEGTSEDSIFELLSGRKPLPPKTDPSYTEMVDLEMDAEDTMGGGLDDTFRDKRRVAETELEIDPLDDSDIF